MAKRKRGLDYTPIDLPINLPPIKERLAINMRKIDSGFNKNSNFNFDEYTRISESIRNDVDTLLEYAQTPEEKFKLTQIVFKIGKFYMWIPWKIGTLSDEQGKEYILGKAMQAEEDQYKYANAIKERRRVVDRKQGIARLSAIQNKYIRTNKQPKKKKPKSYKDYKKASKTTALAKQKLLNLIKLHKKRTLVYKNNPTKENKEQMELVGKQGKTAREEYLDAKQDLSIKEEAYKSHL